MNTGVKAWEFWIVVGLLVVAVYGLYSFAKGLSNSPVAQAANFLFGGPTPGFADQDMSQINAQPTLADQGMAGGSSGSGSGN
jgi:hypothetical protein